MRTSRRSFTALMVMGGAFGTAASGPIGPSILDFGARAKADAINTVAIQSGIDSLAAGGGGTLVVPRGTFVTGALFLRPGVHLHLARGAVLKCTNDMAHFPPRRTRIEGHFEESYTPALLNAHECHGLRITGEGVLDGSGRPVWDRFWAMHDAAPDPANFANIAFPRARLALFDNCHDVLVEGVTFKDSQFWNLHLYNCEDVTVRGVSFTVPDDYRQAPSSDGIDIDSCRRVVVEDCLFSVTDDCIAAKGSKGPKALEDTSSPPVEDILIRRCQFRRGHHAFACGSEATIVRDVLMEECKVTGEMVLLRLKLRPDTPQLYERIMLREITLDNAAGSIMGVEPWTQYRQPVGANPPQSRVTSVVLCGIRGRYGAFGTLRPNPGQTRIDGVRFCDIDLSLETPELQTEGVEGLVFENVEVNGEAIGQS